MCLLCGYGQAPRLHCFNSQNRDWFRQTAAYSAAVLRREHPGSPCSSLLDLMACWPDYREQLSNSHTSVAWFVACCSSSVIATRNAHQSLQLSNIIFWNWKQWRGFNLACLVENMLILQIKIWKLLSKRGALGRLRTTHHTCSLSLRCITTLSIERTNIPPLSAGARRGCK